MQPAERITVAAGLVIVAAAYGVMNYYGIMHAPAWVWAAALLLVAAGVFAGERRQA